MTPEGRVKSAVDKVLISAQAYYHKPVQNGMGAPALDYSVIHRGVAAVIEAKDFGKRPTPRQTRTMKKVIAAGGAVFLIDHGSGVDFAQLHGWLLNPIPGFVSTTARTWLASKEAADAEI